MDAVKFLNDIEGISRSSSKETAPLNFVPLVGTLRIPLHYQNMSQKSYNRCSTTLKQGTCLPRTLDQIEFQIHSTISNGFDLFVDIML